MSHVVRGSKEHEVKVLGGSRSTCARLLFGRAHALLIGMAIVLLFTACGPASQTSPSATYTADATKPAVSATPTVRALPEGNDWTQYRYDLVGTGFNPEGRITSATSAKLALAWTATAGGFLSTPAIVNGVVYAASHESLYAYDLLTGASKWHPNDLGEGGAINSSVAVDPKAHMAFFGTSTARVAAIDTNTGAILWNTQLANPKAGAYIWSSPLLANNKLYIGLASYKDDPCVRGAVYALDPHSGVLLWTHYTVPEGSLGGAVWSSVTADPDAHQLIVTTGNPCPEGSVAYENDAIVGLDWDTGATRWKYTAISLDNCDCDFGEGAVTYTLNGQKYVVAGNKFGAVYAIHPPTGNGKPTLAWTARIARAGFVGKGGI